MPAKRKETKEVAANSGNRIRVRIVVAGDQGTGKSSLIVSDVADNFPANVPLTQRKHGSSNMIKHATVSKIQY